MLHTRSFTVICSSSFSYRKHTTSRNASVLSFSCRPPNFNFFEHNYYKLSHCTKIDITNPMINCICCMQIMSTQNSCLYTCFPNTARIVSFNSVVLTDNTSKPFLLFPIIAGWPQKKQFELKQNLSSADLSTCLSEAAASSVVPYLILLAICCILQYFHQQC